MHQESVFILRYKAGKLLSSNMAATPPSQRQRNMEKMGPPTSPWRKQKHKGRLYLD
jgi:hypothetical protein